MVETVLYAVDLFQAIFSEASTVTTSVSTPPYFIPTSVPQLTPETAKFMESIFSTPTSTIQPRTSTSRVSDPKDEQIAKIQANVDALQVQVANLNEMSYT
ncbi:hypothetical protein L1987_65853 [Smallanthus sonchifolius]|uniref:Uncharacterized protein n=1 Tax=Smallanthus sonchifolius TaxID=185202 RepID=A0ACB9BVN0_9ASTR|nr:hypothetical protein L1987_65853 [Smallanthus sonchifolius]